MIAEMFAKHIFKGSRCAVIALTFLCGLSRLFGAAPTLTHVFPAGGQRGTKVVVTCAGTFTWPVQVWAPGVEAVPSKASGKLEITIPADLAADRIWIRLYNSEGASAAAPFLIGSLKEVTEQEPNDTLREAQAIGEPNHTINGVLSKAGDVDCFSVQLKAGQTLVAAIDANTRLGSPMDAILQVVSLSGTVLAENHDDLLLDPRLAYTAPKDGSYIVRLFAFPASPDTSIRFSGGPDYIYRLTLTTGPFITHAVPLSAPMSNPGSVEVQGWNIPPKTKLPVRAFGSAGPGTFPEFEATPDLRIPPDAKLGIAFGPQFAGAARIRLVSSLVTARAPADAPSPQTLTLPTSVTGRLRNRRQIDEFQLPLKKGQPIVVSVEANSLYFPVDPVVKLVDPDGKPVANVDDTGPSKDVALTYPPARDGTFRLLVTDRYGRGGERSWYLLTARPEEPDFELSVGSDAIVVSPGKPTELAVKIQRRTGPAGSVGPVTIQPVGLPPGVTAPAVTSEPTGPTASTVTLKFTASGAAFSGAIKIVGQSSKPKDFQRFARTPPKLGVAFESIWLTAVEKK